MLAKLHVLLVALLLMISSACRTDTANQSSGNPQQPAPVQQPGAAPSPASPDAAPAAKVKIDACTLLTPEEIKSVQGEELKETRPSIQTSGALVVSQCFYLTLNFTNSVNLTVMQKNADAEGARNPRDVWREKFGSGAEQDDERKKEKEREREKERGGKSSGEEEESAPPLRVAGVGDDAYWTGNQKLGALYVLKGDVILWISVGGAGDQQTKIKRTRTLAQQSLKRIQGS
jgi:hypothetical protein